MNIYDVMSRGSDRVAVQSLASSRAAWICFTALIAVLGSCLGALVWYAQRPDDALPTFQRHFEDLRRVEAKWDAGILALQLGISPNYDDVTASARELDFGLERLQTEASREPELEALMGELKSYRTAIGEKQLMFQQVKASYAMLRNAVSVLPNAIADCYVHPDVLELVGADNKRVSDVITESINGMMSFLISPTPLLKAEVSERLARTRDVSAKVQPELARSLGRLLAQIDVVVRERYRGNELTLKLNAVNTNGNATRILGQLQALDIRHVDMKRNLWSATLLLSALLAASIVALLYLLSRRFLKLSEANVMLQQVNENVEEQLVQSAKLSALGQMVAGITHEINTPLAYVRAVFELIRERMMANPVAPTSDGQDSSDEESHEELVMLLDDGLHGLDEIATLIRTMKNFSRLDKGTIESFSVEEGIESALLLAKPQLKYVANVKKEFDSVPNIMASPTQLRQVLLNLIVNAADAMATMDRRGTLTLRTRITSSDTVQIDVCDDGPGISEENLAKIFDPFFTTKAVGHGTGMGLSICYRIIENHGGTIAINSKVSKGTVITITLPRQDATFTASTKAATARAVSLAPETPLTTA